MQILFKFFVCLIGVCGYSVIAQNFPQMSLYNVTKMAHNPANTAMEIGMELEGAGRWQWVGLDGAPKTQMIGLQADLPGIKTGVGLGLINDKVGLMNHSQLFLNTRYTLVQKDWKLNIGIQGLLGIMEIDGTGLITPQGDYEGSINHQDNIIPNTVISKGLTMNLGFGAIFVSKKDWLLGISILNLLDSKLESSNSSQLLFSGRNFVLQSQNFFDIGYNFQLNPSLLIKSDLVDIQAEVQGDLVIREFIHFLVGVRGYTKHTLDAGIVGLGCQIRKNIFVAYAYDFGLSNLASAHNGSHEVGLRLKFGNFLVPEKGKVIFNPRFL